MRTDPKKATIYSLLATFAAVLLLEAGSLEPPGAPSPTMRTLDSIPSSWHQQLGLLRFEIVMNGEAVLDHETGLVWQRSVQNVAAPMGLSWEGAVAGCRSLLLGNRYGWRLPSVEEMGTLVDVGQFDPALPPLHPFVSEETGEFVEYWTSTSKTGSATLVWTVSFEANGSLNHDRVKSTVTPTDPSAWCVRGSVGLDTGRP
jgi:hypothetical protein